VGTEVPARRMIPTSRRRKNRVVVASQNSGDTTCVPNFGEAKTDLYKNRPARFMGQGDLSRFDVD